MSHKKEKVWWHKGLPCVVLMTSMGHRCGYVGVSPTHPLWGRSYSKHIPALNQLLINRMFKDEEEKEERVSFISWLCWDGQESRADVVFEVHGGVTFMDGGRGYPEDIPCWVSLTTRSRAEIDFGMWWVGYDCGHSGDGKDLSVLKPSLRRIYESHSIHEGTLRSLEYCVEECNHLANQIDYVEYGRYYK